MDNSYLNLNIRLENYVTYLRVSFGYVVTRLSRFLQHHMVVAAVMVVEVAEEGVVWEDDFKSLLTYLER